MGKRSGLHVGLAEGHGAGSRGARGNAACGTRTRASQGSVQAGIRLGRPEEPPACSLKSATLVPRSCHEEGSVVGGSGCGGRSHAAAPQGQQPEPQALSSTRGGCGAPAESAGPSGGQDPHHLPCPLDCESPPVVVPDLGAWHLGCAICGQNGSPGLLPTPSCGHPEFQGEPSATPGRSEH